ncbi:MAG: hypothetical protein MJ211_07895 [Bacteroidales bacterium]|nr:hypothetical protein [Bacteroidales bacterium]
MVIENGLTTSKYRLAYIVTAMLVIGSFVYTYFDKFNFKPFFIAACICAFIHIVLVIINPSYFSLNDSEDPIVIKKFTAYPIFRKCVSFNAKKSLLYKYSISKRFFGLQKFITITLRGYNKQKQIEEYTFPKFNISALNSEQIDDLEKCLNRYINANLERISNKK